MRPSSPQERLERYVQEPEIESGKCAQRQIRQTEIELDWTGSGTLATATILRGIYQVRVFRDVRGYLSFGSTSPAVLAATQLRTKRLRQRVESGINTHLS